VGLRARCRDVAAAHADVGPVVRAHPGEAGDGGQNGLAAVDKVAAAEGQVVTWGVLFRVTGCEDLQPIVGAVALSCHQDDRRRTASAALQEDRAAAADVEQACDIFGDGDGGRWTTEQSGDPRDAGDSCDPAEPEMVSSVVTAQEAILRCRAPSPDAMLTGATAGDPVRTTPIGPDRTNRANFMSCRVTRALAWRYPMRTPVAPAANRPLSPGRAE